MAAERAIAIEAAGVTLAPGDIEAIALRTAELVAEMLDPSRPVADTLIDAAEVARRHGVTRGFVYEHAQELGAIRLGDGPRARLRFDPERVAGRLSARDEAPTPQPAPQPRPRRRRSSPAVDLLPVLGPQP